MSMRDDELEDSSAPLIEHLAELRTRLIHSVLAFIVGMVICFTIATPIFNFLTAPLCQVLADRGQDCDLIFISPQEGFFVAIKVSLLGGFILAFPYIANQMWRFVAPGLYRSEKGAFLPFLVATLSWIMLAFSLGPGPFSTVFVNEVVPTEHRAKSSAWSCFLNRITSASVALSFLPLSSAFGAPFVAILV